jgi:hypothetical protein
MPLTIKQVAQKTKKILMMNRDLSLIDNVYINPAWAKNLSTKVPELEENGFYITVIESTVPEGKSFMGKIRHYAGSELQLGSVVLDGKKVVVDESLIDIEDLMGFLLVELQ